VMLPERIDAASLFDEAIREKVAFVPGAAFHPLGGGQNTMRLNFSNASEAMIEQGMTRLCRVIRRQLEALGARLPQGAAGRVVALAPAGGATARPAPTA